jgi:alkylation response protein AidB-like acyl-CoA dehydrogenase
MAAIPSWSDEDVEAFRDLVRRFFEKECAPNEERWAEQQHVDREIWNQAGELGILCPSIPTEYGGGGGTFAHEAVVAEEQMRSGAASLGTAVHSTIVAHYILNYGSEEQKQRWLPKLASGEMVGAIAMTEPGTGSDLQNVRTKAIKRGSGGPPADEGVAGGGEYVLDGSKTFISNGLLANLVIVVAKTDPNAKASAGTSLLVVEREMPGFERGRNLNKVGMKAQDTAELFFTNVRVPGNNLLGEENRGFIHLMENLPQERLSIAVGAISSAAHVLEMTIEYCETRTAFGKPIGSFQNSRFVLAELATEVEIARHYVDKAILEHNAGRFSATDAAMAKWWTTEMQKRVIDSCESSTHACSCTAVTATCWSTPSRRRSSTAVSRPSTAGAPRS